MLLGAVDYCKGSACMHFQGHDVVRLARVGMPSACTTGSAPQGCSQFLRLWKRGTPTSCGRLEFVAWPRKRGPLHVSTRASPLWLSTRRRMPRDRRWKLPTTCCMRSAPELRAAAVRSSPESDDDGQRTGVRLHRAQHAHRSTPCRWLAGEKRADIWPTPTLQNV